MDACNKKRGLLCIHLFVLLLKTDTKKRKQCNRFTIFIQGLDENYLVGKYHHPYAFARRDSFGQLNFSNSVLEIAQINTTTVNNCFYKKSFV